MDYLKGEVSKLLIVVLLCLSILTDYGLGEIISLSKEEDMELERQLKVLNKPPIKTIITKMGDIFDCIDIYKQPAFDHPLLGNHKIQMEPNLILKETIGKAAATIVDDPETVVDKKRCPSGTVPIRRTKKEDLVHAKYLYTRNNQYPVTQMNHHFVSVEPSVKGKVYYGGQAVIGLHNPKVEQDQFSTAQIWIQNGPAEKINSIEFGWAVYPILTGDNLTRTFGYWTADGHRETGCFNMLCPGFVQVDPNTSLGDDVDRVSVYKGKRVGLTSTVYRDPQSGNWWLIFRKKDKIGYWPKELFSYLSDNASIVRYGGVAGAKPNRPTPPMGDGHLPKGIDFTVSGFMTEMKVINEKGAPINFDTSKTLRKQDTEKDCYDLSFNGNYWFLGIFMTFGGPGGVCY